MLFVVKSRLKISFKKQIMIVFRLLRYEEKSTSSRFSTKDCMETKQYTPFDLIDCPEIFRIPEFNFRIEYNDNADFDLSG